MATKTKKPPAKKRSHSKKPERTAAQTATVDRLKADAEHYGVDDFETKHDGPNVVVTASGRRWVVDVQGHVST